VKAWAVLAVIALALPAAAEVPITIAPTGHALVSVAIEGRGAVPMVFDTGAEGSALYAATAAAWSLPAAGAPAQLVGQTGTAEVGLVRLPAATLDGVTVEGIDAALLPPRADGQVLNGIVGLDLFGGKVLDFDLPRRRLALLDSARVLTARTVAVGGQRVAGNLLAVPIFAGKVMATAVIDTGARKTRINWKFAQALGLSEASEGFAKGEVIRGATNVPVPTLAGTLPVVTLGGVTLRDAPVLVADLPVFALFGVSDRPAVILGLDWLERARMVIDFPNDRVWFLEPEPAQ
jgi:predicted aspartyl protease